MKTFINLLSLAIAIYCSVFAATQTASAQTTNPFGGTTTVFVPTPIKATDARVAECRKLPELKNLTIDLDNIYEVHDDGTGRGCIILPIKLPIPTRTGSANETTYSYCWVYYDLRNFKNHEVIFCNAKVSRTEAGAQIVNAVINDAKGAMLVSMLYQNNDLRITQGTTPRAGSYGDCVDGNYSGAKGAFAGAAAGACMSGVVLACAGSAGYLAGTLLGCAIF